MDLCLQGSQINLVERQKPRPKYNSQTNLQRGGAFFPTNNNSNSRPRSASLFSKRSRSSPFLGRPQSAEPSAFSTDRFGRLSRRYQSISSSSLLQLLLKEPIKRPWLCRAGTSTASSQSELSSVGKPSHTTPYYLGGRRARTESCGGSSNDSVEQSKHQINNNSKYFARMSSTSSSIGNLLRDKSASSDFWRPAKPDLPGRVSFSKPHQHEADSSDCDNDKQAPYTATDNISAPGPVTLPNTSSFSLKPEFELPNATNSAPEPAAAAKKTVHFGTAASVGGSAEGVLAETYEYPKCPSENCSCSTRSSSTTSTQDGADMIKCICDLPTCKYNSESARRVSLTTLETLDKSANTPSNSVISHATAELEVIREYKHVVGDKLENSVVKNLLEEETPSKFAELTDATNKALELPSYLEKYAATNKFSHVLLEKQNNLSEPKHMSPYKTGLKQNFLESTTNELEYGKPHNNLENNLKMQSNYSTSSETVINNYLKVAANATHMPKKKENNRPDSIEYKKNLPINHTRQPKLKATSKSKLKKATSFGSVREDSNLDEFNLDKVDSWMSIQQSREKRLSLDLDRELEQFAEQTLACDDDGDEVDAEEDADECAVSASPISTKSDVSTYDEIVSVIKEIDEDKNKDNFAEKAASELELKLSSEANAVNSPETAVNTEKGDPKDSPDKFKDILTYLDTVEDSCDRTLLETRRSIPESNRSEVEFIVEPDIAEEMPKLADLLMLPNHQLARRVVALSLRANELAQAVYYTKEQLNNVRAEKQKCVRTEKANSVNRIREQKRHYESIVKRHQGFIEQLLKDKGSLCEKVAALTRRLESQNQAWEHKLEAEVTRVKETTLAGEKIRRERWVRENTKKIKELTVKGLEIEINKMTCNHQREVTELKQAHQQQLLDALEEARIKHEQIENSIRESCAQDREAIIEKERTAIRERFERQFAEERKSFDDQKQSLIEEFAAERERLHGELKAKEADYQVRRQELQREKEHELEQTVAELQEKMSKQDEKYQNRINTIEKQYEADFEIWKRDYENNCKLAQVEKENTIRQHYRAERDRQIDAIVSRMDAEALKQSEEFEAKVNRITEKYEKDVELLENGDKLLREKYTETRSKLAEADAQVRNSQAEIKQLQLELGHSKKMCDDMLTERDQLRDNLRNEIQSEVAALKADRDNEIQKIHKRVQQAIEKKDATIDILQKENGTLRERCLKLEAVIRQQRKDYCAK